MEMVKEKELNLDKVRDIIVAIDTVKCYAVKLRLMREYIEEEYKPLDTFSNDEELQKAVKEVYNAEVKITLKDLLKELPNPQDYIVNVNSLEELLDVLERYISEGFVPVLKEFFDEKDTYEMGTNKFYNELPLYEAEEFVDCFHTVANQPEELEYGVTIYDLNDELWVNFATEEEARNFAETVAPCTVWQFEEGTNNALELDNY